MNTILKRTLTIVAIVSWVASILWFIYQPGFEPLLAFLGGIAALIGSMLVDSDGSEGGSIAGVWGAWKESTSSTTTIDGHSESANKGGIGGGTAIGPQAEVTFRDVMSARTGRKDEDPQRPSRSSHDDQENSG